jgi:hypothetical protein
MEDSAMTASGDQEKLIFSMLAEIQSDLRQIRHDLQLLLDERQKPTMPASSPDGGDEADSSRDANSTSEDVLRYFRVQPRRRDLGSD